MDGYSNHQHTGLTEPFFFADSTAAAQRKGGDGRRMDRNKNGLVLEGGGMRGVYTAGVLDAFLEARL